MAWSWKGRWALLAIHWGQGMVRGSLPGLRWAERGVEPKLPALGPKDRGIWGVGYWFRQKKQVLTKSESSMIWNDLEKFGFFEVNS